MDFIKVDNSITLSPLVEDDFFLFIERINDPKVYDNTLKIPYPYSLKDAQNALDNFSNCSKSFGKSTSWCIRKNGEVVGGLGFHALKPSHKTEFGYWLASKFWNQGIMTKVIAKICKIAFEDYQFDRLEAVVVVSNIASATVLEKNGFILEAPLLKNFEKKKGKLRDCKLYALTK
jgi:ribosomal-protein-alanine N-acetyltransferase|tara:strand:- start:48 stop:572 length:525 start_codon:yes stop_codon:yes gene_type:complete